MQQMQWNRCSVKTRTLMDWRPAKEVPVGTVFTYNYAKRNAKVRLTKNHHGCVAHLGVLEPRDGFLDGMMSQSLVATPWLDREWLFYPVKRDTANSLMTGIHE